MNDCPAESENPFTVSVHPSTLPPPCSLRALQNVRLLDSIGIIKSLGSIPFTWCHDLSSANSWLKIIHPTIRHKHFVLSIFVDDLESTILNRSSVRFHSTLQVYTPFFLRDHHISAILARAAKAAHVISRKRPGSELTTERPFLAARFWVESSSMSNAIEIYNLKPISIFTAPTNHWNVGNGTVVVLISFEEEF